MLCMENIAENINLKTFCLTELRNYMYFLVITVIVSKPAYDVTRGET